MKFRQRVGYSFLIQFVTQLLSFYGGIIFFDFLKSARVLILARSVIGHPYEIF